MFSTITCVKVHDIIVIVDKHKHRKAFTQRQQGGPSNDLA